MAELEDLMSERQWQGIVEGLLAFYGWRFYHPPDNRPGGKAGRPQRVTPGYPDVTALRCLPELGPELLIAELKTGRGAYGEGQREWLAAFEAFAGAVAVMDYSDLADPWPAPDDWHRPAVGVYTWRPAQRLEVEAILAGPAGIGVMVEGP